jgi:hypothetical protein
MGLHCLSERKTPRFKRRLVSLAKKPSTAFSQDAEVGVKWNVRRLTAANIRVNIVGNVRAEIVLLLARAKQRDQADHEAGALPSAEHRLALFLECDATFGCVFCCKTDRLQITFIFNRLFLRHGEGCFQIEFCGLGGDRCP